MKEFKNLISSAAPLDAANVDTDQIIPKNFLKRIERTGFGQFLFYEWRFDMQGKENPEFVLNKKEFKDAKILLARDNFGCGSSREHAPWALQDYGFTVIIAPSFADIFYNNCFQNGILPIVLSSKNVDALFQHTLANPSAQYEIDLPSQKVISKDNSALQFSFEIRAALKEKLLKGLDDIGWTLQFANEIEHYEKNLQISFN
ncbi:MAG: 3-isopropylmalate dehydratase small subunit [Leptospiraceae bacterium]|nr:3-isopropylmalate dehydratase small subunit [Leptospiraceae bacterium]MCB1200178.1 3-isopropylmalate dehydratase small subunit [Leptospiraceae bacterium]